MILLDTLSSSLLGTNRSYPFLSFSKLFPLKDRREGTVKLERFFDDLKALDRISLLHLKKRVCLQYFGGTSAFGAFFSLQHGELKEV